MTGQILRRLTGVAAATVVVACEQSPTPPPPTQPAQLHLTALVSASSVTSIVVTVSAADISPSLVFNFPVSNGLATGTMTVPVGSDRHFHISAFDAAGVETQQADTTITVQSGANAPLAVTLTPLTGSQPIVVTISGLRIVVQPADTSVSVGGSASFRAQAFDATGSDITSRVTFTWASSNPSIASVDSHGMVTAHLVGAVSIVAVAGGVAGVATLTDVAESPVLRNVIIYTTEEFGFPEIAIVHPDGSGRQRLTTDQFAYAAPVISPDGRRIAFASAGDGTWAIYLMNADGSGRSKLVGQSNLDGAPAWSPDGHSIAFRRENEGPYGPFGRIFLVNVDGTGLRQLTPDSPDYTFDEGPTWSPDGTKIAFTRNGVLHVINADGSGFMALPTARELAGYPAWSPDGAHIAYAGQSGSWGIYIANPDGSNLIRLTTDSAQKGMPRWSPDGQELVFVRVVNGISQLFRIRSDGTSEVKLSAAAVHEGWPSWSPLP